MYLLMLVLITQLPDGNKRVFDEQIGKYSDAYICGQQRNIYIKTHPSALTACVGPVDQAE